MSRPVRVHLLPTLFEPPELQGGVAVVIDVLRASTTIIQALQAGAQAVCPCATTDEARTLAARLPDGQRLLGGERHGVRIAGFDLDNSPRGYTPERVGGKWLCFTTTNGTAALRRCDQAAAVGVGAFVNLSAMLDWLHSTHGPVHLVCAGTDGCVTTEDVLLAGLLASRLPAAEYSTADDSTQLALSFAAQHASRPAAILDALTHSRGGRNLLELGFAADIAFAAQVDAVPVVPVWQRDRGELRVWTPGR